MPDVSVLCILAFCTLFLMLCEIRIDPCSSTGKTLADGSWY